MTAKETRALYERAIEHYGPRHQVYKAIEECGELVQALCKYEEFAPNAPATVNAVIAADALVDHVSEEMADLLMTWEQLTMLFQNEAAVLQWKDRKLDRLKERLEAET